MFKCSMILPMPTEMKVQEEELHQKVLAAIDDGDFVKAHVLYKEQSSLWDEWYKYCALQSANS
jgi:hypothetical protein